MLRVVVELAAGVLPQRPGVLERAWREAGAETVVWMTMARARSAEKRQALLEAAVAAIAEKGLGAATSHIAERAGVASGTLFTYFASKEELLNAVYLMLKSELYGEVGRRFPDGAGLRERVRHIWTVYQRWTMRSPERLKVSRLLHVADVIGEETLAAVAAERQQVDETMEELERLPVFRGMPAGFAGVMMSAMLEAARTEIQRGRGGATVSARAFAMFWAACDGEEEA